MKHGDGKVPLNDTYGNGMFLVRSQDHTVGDLQAFCAQCVGGMAMTIMGGFPPKPITDSSLTLKAAGLLNAAVTVKPA